MTTPVSPCPGPWEAVDIWIVPSRFTWERARLVYDAEAKLVAIVPEYPGFSDATARARFIAAAPELTSKNTELQELVVDLASMCLNRTTDDRWLCRGCWTVSSDGKRHDDGCAVGAAQALAGGRV